MAKKTDNKPITDVQSLFNFLYEACNILRGPVGQDGFKDYITPLLYYKRISDVWDEETARLSKSRTVTMNMLVCRNSTVS